MALPLRPSAASRAVLLPLLLLAAAAMLVDPADGEAQPPAPRACVERQLHPFPLFPLTAPAPSLAHARACAPRRLRVRGRHH